MSSTVAQTLAAAVLDPLEARALLRHVLGVGDAYLLAHGDAAINRAQEAAFLDLAARRAAGEPLPYITGRREFYSLEFKVTPAVLIPRPETELLVEFALERIAPQGCARVLDLGTGSGCVAISIARERPRALVTATDASLEALAVAQENARLHAAGNVEFLRSDWFSALAGMYDLIVANPPYVAAGDPHLEQGDLRFEPRAALVAGTDGLECIRAIIAKAPHLLAHSAWLAVEHGYDQAENCRDLLRKSGFSAVFSRRDLAGIERVSGGRRAVQS